jgi:hypothetical protein
LLRELKIEAAQDLASSTRVRRYADASSPSPMLSAFFAALRFFLSAVPHLPLSLVLSVMAPRSSNIYCAPFECPMSAEGTGPLL